MARFHIVTTTDFSDSSMQALDAAAALARRLDARITLLHILHDVPAIPHGAPLAPPQHDPGLPAERHQAEERLQAARARLPQDLEVAAVVAVGARIAMTICAQARELDANLLLLASRGRNQASELLLGSTAEQVLRHASVPTLVLPVGRDARPLQLD
ncbi:MAG: universal stress protein [Planctomycetota bacterium]